MTTPNRIPVTKKIILVSPEAAKESLNIIVEIINPVFLISCEYLSVYLKEINSSNTSTKIRMVKKSTKNRKSILTSYLPRITTLLNQS